MRINNNISAMITQGALFKANRAQGKSLEKLATGLRINRAADDAAGLGVSEKLRVQVRGNSQALKNVQDAISMLNIGEGGLNEVHELLQRGRELALQSANDTLTDTERGYLNQEIQALTDEITRIAETTTFNGIQVLQSSVDSDLADDITSGLQNSWIQDALTLINTQYGLSGSGVDLTVHLESDIDWATAYVSYTQKGQPLELHIDASSSSFDPGYVANGTAAEVSGGSSPFYSDRIIAHEMVHALLADSVQDTYQIPTWMNEGLAELIHGADERVLSSLGGNPAPTVANYQTLIDANALNGAWASDSDAYSNAYLALRYFSSEITTSMTAFIDDLETGGGGSANLDAAIAGNTTFVDLADFITNYEGGNGATWLAANITLGDADTGAIGGGTALSVVANGGDDVADVIADFNMSYAPIQSNYTIRVDALDDTAAEVEIETSGVSASNLGIDSTDISTQTGAVQAISDFTTAINSVSTTRTKYGTYINRFEHTVNNLMVSVTNQQASESLIRDTDFASETARFTRSQILTQSSTAMLAQANVSSQVMLQLLS